MISAIEYFVFRFLKPRLVINSANLSIEEINPASVPLIPSGAIITVPRIFSCLQYKLILFAIKEVLSILANS